MLTACESAENFNPLNAELNPICHLLVLLGTHHIFHVSGLRVKLYNKWFIYSNNRASEHENCCTLVTLLFSNDFAEKHS